MRRLQFLLSPLFFLSKPICNQAFLCRSGSFLLFASFAPVSRVASGKQARAEPLPTTEEIVPSLGQAPNECAMAWQCPGDKEAKPNLQEHSDAACP